MAVINTRAPAGGAGTNPSPPAFAVNHYPTGPNTPASGWTTVMASAFNPANPLGQPTSIWGLNRDNNNGNNAIPLAQGGSNCGGFNANEQQVFDAGQVFLGQNGLTLTATYMGNNFYGAGLNYRSGCISSQPINPVGGQTGWAITGWGYLPQVGVIHCMEVELQLPGYVGQDMGWWAAGPGTGANEQDFMEFEMYVGGAPGQWQFGTAWINHTSSASNGNTVYNPTQMTDGKFHRWTTMIDGTSQTVYSYVDGVYIPNSNYAWIAFPPVYNCNLLLSHAMRNAYAGQGATFTGSMSVNVKSAACYQPTSQAGTGITGIYIDPGTTVI